MHSFIPLRHGGLLIGREKIGNYGHVRTTHRYRPVQCDEPPFRPVLDLGHRLTHRRLERVSIRLSGIILESLVSSTMGFIVADFVHVMIL